MLHCSLSLFFFLFSVYPNLPAFPVIYPCTSLSNSRITEDYMKSQEQVEALRKQLRAGDPMKERVKDLAEQVPPNFEHRHTMASVQLVSLRVA